MSLKVIDINHLITVSLWRYSIRDNNKWK